MLTGLDSSLASLVRHKSRFNFFYVELSFSHKYSLRILQDFMVDPATVAAEVAVVRTVEITVRPTIMPPTGGVEKLKQQISLLYNEHTNRHSPFDYFSKNPNTLRSNYLIFVKKFSHSPKKHQHYLNFVFFPLSSLKFLFFSLPSIFEIKSQIRSIFFKNSLSTQTFSRPYFLLSFLFITNLLLIF